MTEFTKFHRHALGSEHCLWVGQLPPELRLTTIAFEELWQLHPEISSEIRMMGRRVKIPRWQQAYGRDYYFSAIQSVALPIAPILEPFLAWSRATIDARLNGLLLNWYDGRQQHYIGPHRDSRTGLIPSAPIVTISFGEERIFRLRPWREQPRSGQRQRTCVDFYASDGAVFVLPYETNLAWTHEVPASKARQGRRLSVTLRAFSTANARQ